MSDERRLEKLEERFDDLKDEVSEIKVDLKENLVEMKSDLKHHLEKTSEMFEKLEPIIRDFQFEKETEKRNMKLVKEWGLKLTLFSVFSTLVVGCAKFLGRFFSSN